MKNLTLPLLFLICLQIQNSFSQGCENADFSHGNFDYWEAFTGFCCGSPINTPGVVNGRHTIISQSIPDPYTNNLIMTMPPTGGGAYSIRLGNSNTGSEADRIKKSILIDNNNKLFIYQYAVVLEDPDGHTPIEKPKFEVRIYDQNNNIVNPYQCGYYQVVAGPQTDTWGIYGDVRFKDWATVGLDLSNYIGTTVTVEFTVQDCGLGGHFGYAYLDCACGFLDIEVIGFCQGNDHVTLNAPSGFSSYLWPSTGQTSESIDIPTPHVGDSVIVTVTNESGCSTNILHVFEELPISNAIAGDDTTICIGQNLQLWADGGGVDGQYTWYANNQIIGTTQNLDITPTESTIFSVIVANGNGCFSPDSLALVSVIVDTNLFFNLPYDTTICGSSNITLTCPIQNVNYNWSDNDNGIYNSTETINVNPSLSTTYYLEISNSQCHYDDSIKIIIQNSTYYPDTNEIHYCNSVTSVNLTAPYDALNSTWSNGMSGNSIIVNPNDTNQVKLNFTTLYGCNDSIVYLLTETLPEIPYITSNSDTICQGTSTIVSADGVSNGYYTWTSIPTGYSNTSNYIIVNPTITTSYVVHATSYNGCSSQSTDTVTIFVDSSAYFTTNNNPSVCEGQSIQLYGNNSNGNYTWTTLGTQFSSEDTITVTGIYSQYYYLTNINSLCSYTQNIYLHVNNVNTNSTPYPFCSSQSSITLTAPSGYSSYFWPYNNSSQNSISLINFSNGQQFSAYCTNYLGCVDTSIQIISLVQATHLNPIPTSTICQGDNIQITATSTGSQDQYYWTSVPSGFFQNGNSVTVSPTITTTYEVTLSNNLNCVESPSTESVTITVIPTINLSLPNLITICEGDSVTIDGSSNVQTYNWNFNGQNYSNPILNFVPQTTGILSLNVTNGPCSGTFNTNISFFQLNNYQIIANPNSPICIGTPVDLTIDGNGNGYNSIKWNENNQVIGVGDIMNVQPITSTNYSALIIDNNNCKNNANLLLEVNQFPEVNLGNDVAICDGIILQLKNYSITNTLSYLWSTNDSSSVISVTTDGLYWLTVTENNCSSTDSIQVNFIPNSNIGQIPNIITINDDKINDLFSFDHQNLDSYEILIVNRWGDLIFKSNDPNQYWDGKHNNTKVTDGVYFYKITYNENCGSNRQQIQTGNITVIN